MDQWFWDYWWLLPVFLIFTVSLVVFCIPAVQAKRRGYSFFVWLAAGQLVLNPIYLLVVLGIAPHRRRQQLREQFRQELDAKIAAGMPAVVAAVRPVPDRSVGDQPTVMPGRVAATDVQAGSVGDAATVMPPHRSLGDEATHV
jgi:heme exporter protein D